MNCKRCGAPITENDQFCKNCGATVNAQPASTGYMQQPAQNPGFVGPQTTPANPSVAQPTQPQASQTAYTQQPTVNPALAAFGQPQVAQPTNTGYSQQPAQNYAPNNNQPQKNNNTIKYIILAVILVVAIAGGILVIGALNKDKESSKSSKASSNNSYTVKYDGYTFTVSNDIIAQEFDDELDFYDDTEEWQVGIGIAEDTYNNFKR